LSPFSVILPPTGEHLRAELPEKKRKRADGLDLRRPKAATQGRKKGGKNLFSVLWWKLLGLKKGGERGSVPILSL